MSSARRVIGSRASAAAVPGVGCRRRPVSGAVQAVLGLVAVTAGALVAPGPARACSGPVPTFDEAVAAARLIVAGDVVASAHDGAYELDVTEVFRGQVEDRILIGSPQPDLNSAICSQRMEVGDEVVVALRTASDLGLFTSGLWYLLPDGTVSTHALEPVAETHEELFARLRLLPDTAVVDEGGASSAVALGGALALVAGLATAIAIRRRL